MRHRAPKLEMLLRVVGHVLAIVGVIYAADAVATVLDPANLAYFPFDAGGIEQAPAAIVAIVLLAVGGWLACSGDYRRRKALADLSRRPPTKRPDRS